MYNYYIMLETIIENYNILGGGTFPDWAYYLTLFLFFFSIIIFVVWSWFFAKWLTAGPKLKLKFKNLKNKLKRSKREKGILIENGEVLIEEDFLKQIDLKIKEAKNPQDLLEFQQQKENLEKEVKKEKEKIKKIEEEKIEKIKNKEEKARMKEESKEIEKKLKTKDKEKKKELKEKKKESKDKENKKRTKR